MKLAYGLSALLLGTTLLAGGAMAEDSHPHFTPHHAHASRGSDDSAPPRSTPALQVRANATANAAQNSHNGSWYWAHRNAGTRSGNGGHGGSYWSSANLHDHNVSHFSAQDRSTWQHGQWSHGHHHGRNGWWWNSGGSWFFYDQPVYPYPGYVSDYYYADDYDNYDGSGYDGDYGPAYAADPRAGGYYWYYCNDPAGYYPYVKSCRGPWRAVTPTPDAQGAYDQGPDGYDNGDDRGPPPGYNGDDRGAAPGYNGNQAPRGDQLNGPQDDDDRGPPPGYNGDDRGPPPGYDNGPDDDDNGPPPSQSPR